MGGECALPPHLKNKLHGDWPWPFSKMKRSSNALGPRCPGYSPSYRPWPPRLIEGHGVARWEMAGAGSVIDIPDLANRTVEGADVYGKSFLAIERNPDHPNFNKDFFITLQEPTPSMVYDLALLQTPVIYKQMVEPNIYSPSALQKFSEIGYMKLFPKYVLRWHMLRWRELPWLEAGAIGQEPEDTVLMYRSGTRPDHVDAYYNGPGLIDIPTVSLKWT